MEQISREAVFCDQAHDQPQVAVWHPIPGRFFVQGGQVSTSFQVHLDELVSIRLVDSAEGEHLALLAYPLVHGTRRRRAFRMYSRSARALYESLISRRQHHHPPPHLTKKNGKIRYLVLLNPYSGQQKAHSLWENECRPLLEETGIEYELCYTERGDHAVQIAQQVQVADYDGLIVISGDGMISEVLTGLATRPDRDRALKLPLLHVPAGTANALAAAVAFQAGEPFSPRSTFCREMILMAVQPAYRPLRLFHVETAKDGHRLMFLSAVWGLIADIDLGSERFRWAGLIRLHMEAFIRLARLPQVARYRGRISYKPIEDTALLRNTRLKSAEVRKSLGLEHFHTDPVQPWDGVTVENGSPIRIENVFDNCDLDGQKFPKLNDPVPSDWTVVEGEFALVSLTSISHIGSDLPYCPSAKLGAETLYLSLVDWRTIKSRFHMAQLLITIDQCKHLDHECFQMIPVRACRVEPAAGAGGFVAVDGEPVSAGAPFQVSVTSLSATLIGRQPRP